MVYRAIPYHAMPHFSGFFYIVYYFCLSILIFYDKFPFRKFYKKNCNIFVQFYLFGCTLSPFIPTFTGTAQFLIIFFFFNSKLEITNFFFYKQFFVLSAFPSVFPLAKGKLPYGHTHTNKQLMKKKMCFLHENKMQKNRKVFNKS